MDLALTRLLSHLSSPSRRISDSAIRRLSRYVRELEAMEAAGEGTVPSRVLAARAGTTAAQVRKDFSSFGSFGKRGMGYAVSPLRERLSTILGVDRRWPVLLVGAGRVGSALFEYPRFRSRGFDFVAVLDHSPEKVGREWKGMRIEHVRDVARIVPERGIRIAILAVPGPEAQKVAEDLVSAGVRGILNFAPTKLRMPPGVAVNDVDLVMELEALSFLLSSGGKMAEGPE
ncbi:MAG: redox-sensing transcriptional repressor Rex [Gemmatimonadota bacterium]